MFFQDAVLTLVTAPGVPQIGVVLQAYPLFVVGCRNGVTDVAAKWFAVGIPWSTFLSAIQRANRCIEPGVKPRDICEWVLNRKMKFLHQ